MLGFQVGGWLRSPIAATKAAEFRDNDRRFSSTCIRTRSLIQLRPYHNRRMGMTVTV